MGLIVRLNLSQSTAAFNKKTEKTGVLTGDNCQHFTTSSVWQNAVFSDALVTSGPRHDTISGHVVPVSRAIKAGGHKLMVSDNYQLNFQLWGDTGQGLELIYVFPDPEENSGNPFLLMFTREDICLVWPGWAPARPYRHILAAIWQLKVWRVVCKYRRVLVLPLDIWHQHMLYETLFMGYRLLIG